MLAGWQMGSYGIHINLTREISLFEYFLLLLLDVGRELKNILCGCIFVIVGAMYC